MKLNINFLVGVLGALIITAVYKLTGHELSAVEMFVAFFASYPWKIGDNIYSLFGGYNPEGNVYSLLGIYQNAGADAFQIFGLSFYQKAGKTATQLFGLSILQEARVNTFHGVGISFSQKTTGHALQFVGFSFIQEGFEIAEQMAGATFLQISYLGDTHQGLGIVVYQLAETNAYQFAGIAGYQNARNKASRQTLGIALYRRGKTLEGHGISVFS